MASSNGQQDPSPQLTCFIHCPFQPANFPKILLRATDDYAADRSLHYTSGPPREHAGHGRLWLLISNAVFHLIALRVYSR